MALSVKQVFFILEATRGKISFSHGRVTLQFPKILHSVKQHRLVCTCQLLNLGDRSVLEGFINLNSTVPLPPSEEL